MTSLSFCYSDFSTIIPVGESGYKFQKKILQFCTDKIINCPQKFISLGPHFAEKRLSSDPVYIFVDLGYDNRSFAHVRCFV